MLEKRVAGQIYDAQLNVRKKSNLVVFRSIDKNSLAKEIKYY